MGHKVNNTFFRLEKKKMKFKFLVFFLFAFKFHLNNTKSVCFNDKLALLDCDCSVLYLTDTFCSNGIIDLACSFNNTSSQVNYIDQVWKILYDMNGFCWSKFQFENVKQLKSYSMFDLTLFGFELNVIPIKLKNVQTINAFAFNTLFDNYLLAIEIDSQVRFQIQIELILILSVKCFSFFFLKESSNRKTSI